MWQNLHSLKLLSQKAFGKMCLNVLLHKRFADFVRARGSALSEWAQQRQVLLFDFGHAFFPRVFSWRKLLNLHQ